jgi:branched-chain amino acid transport system substrate-binding protein
MGETARLAARRLAGLLAAGLAAALLSAPARAEAPPIRVGFLTVRSGALAAGGRQMEEGLSLFLKQRNHTLAGRKVELFVADTGGQPAMTKTKAQELVERNDVQVIIGPLAAFEALAIDGYVRQAQIPVISPSAAAEDLTQRKPNPWFVRAVGTSAQPSHALGEYAAKELKYRRVAMIADDFAFGHELSAGFQRTFEENGGKVVQKLWSPLNVADYGSYIAQLRNDVDAVFAGFAGANGIRFLKQYAEYGLKVPVLGAMTTVDEGILKNMGDEAVGVVSAGWYAATSEAPGNAGFVKAVEAEVHAVPGYYTVGAYDAGLFLEQALNAVGGKIEDKKAFMAALRKVHLAQGPLGEVRLDEYGNPIMNVYIRKVQRVNGRLQNTVVKTYPAVSQFWTFSPKEFLSNPVYSRDWPPARHLER